MKKIIILLLFCGVLIGMVGCGSNTAPPPIESLLRPRTRIRQPSRLWPPHSLKQRRGEQHVSTELKYGQYVDLAPYGLPNDSYYKGYRREAIGMGDWFGTAESMAERITSGFRNSQKHWSYVGSSAYKYIAVGVTKANDKWYVCILMSDDNYGG